MKSSNFWYQSCLYMFSFQENYTLYAENFWNDQNLAICGQKLAIFDQMWHLGKFLTYNFQILLWNLPIFYIKIVGLSALAGRPMDSRSCVRAWRHIYKTAHQILIIFCTRLHLDESKKMFQADFWKKFSFAPRGFCTQNYPFLSKMA